MIKRCIETVFRDPNYWDAGNINKPIVLPLNDTEVIVIDKEYLILNNDAQSFTNCLRQSFLISGKIIYSDIPDIYPDHSNIYLYVVLKEFKNELKYTFDYVFLTAEEYESTHSLYTPRMWDFLNTVSGGLLFKIFGNIKDGYSHVSRCVDAVSAFTYCTKDVTFELDLSCFNILDCRISKESIAFKVKITKAYDSNTKNSENIELRQDIIWLKIDYKRLNTESKYNVDEVSVQHEIEIQADRSKSEPIVMLPNDESISSDMISYKDPNLVLYLTTDCEEIS